jgi:hypothetical protein
VPSVLYPDWKETLGRTLFRIPPPTVQNLAIDLEQYVPTSVADRVSYITFRVLPPHSACCDLVSQISVSVIPSPPALMLSGQQAGQLVSISTQYLSARPTDRYRKMVTNFSHGIHKVWGAMGVLVLAFFGAVELHPVRGRSNGSSKDQLFGCDHSHFVPEAPHGDFRAHMQPRGIRCIRYSTHALFSSSPFIYFGAPCFCAPESGFDAASGISGRFSVLNHVEFSAGTHLGPGNTGSAHPRECDRTRDEANEGLWRGTIFSADTHHCAMIRTNQTSRFYDM